MKRINVIIIILLSLILLNGCATLADARSAKGSGSVQVYDSSFEDVWDIVPKALTELGLTIAGENKSEGYILAQRGMSAFSYGENVAVFVKKAGERNTSVEVVSKKAMSTTIFAPNWEPKVLTKIGEMLSSQ